MKKLLNDKIGILTLEKTFNGFLPNEVKDHRSFLYVQESLKILDHIRFVFTAPRGHELYHISNPHLGVLARYLHPCVFTVHDLIPYMFPRLLTDLVIKKNMDSLVCADRVICVSEQTKLDLLRLLDVDQKGVSVIHNGVDHSIFRPRDKERARQLLDLPNNSPIILHVGTEEPRKNIPVLLSIFNRLSEESPDALLVRLGDRTESTSRLIKALNLERKILYFREMDDFRLSYLYNAADLFLFPSTYEGFGMPPLEAMASGCPVIAANKASIPEVVGEAGILLDPDDVDSFAYRARQVLEDHELRLKLTTKGLKRSKGFTWEKCAKATLETYRYLV